MHVTRIVVMGMLMVALATMGYAQTGAMTPEQMKMMSGQMKRMSDQMKSGKMTADQMKMMAREGARDQSAHPVAKAEGVRARRSASSLMKGVVPGRGKQPAGHRH